MFTTSNRPSSKDLKRRLDLKNITPKTAKNTSSVDQRKGRKTEVVITPPKSSASIADEEEREVNRLKLRLRNEGVKIKKSIKKLNTEVERRRIVSRELNLRPSGIKNLIEKYFDDPEVRALACRYLTYPIKYIHNHTNLVSNFSASVPMLDEVKKPVNLSAKKKFKSKDVVSISTSKTPARSYTVNVKKDESKRPNTATTRKKAVLSHQEMNKVGSKLQMKRPTATTSTTSNKLFVRLYQGNVKKPENKFRMKESTAATSSRKTAVLSHQGNVKKGKAKRPTRNTSTTFRKLSRRNVKQEQFEWLIKFLRYKLKKYTLEATQSTLLEKYENELKNWFNLVLRQMKHRYHSKNKSTLLPKKMIDKKSDNMSLTREDVEWKANFVCNTTTVITNTAPSFNDGTTHACDSKELFALTATCTSTSTAKDTRFSFESAITSTKLNSPTEVDPFASTIVFKKKKILTPEELEENLLLDQKMQLELEEYFKNCTNTRTNTTATTNVIAHDTFATGTTITASLNKNKHEACSDTSAFSMISDQLKSSDDTFGSSNDEGERELHDIFNNTNQEKALGEFKNQLHKREVKNSFTTTPEEIQKYKVLMRDDPAYAWTKQPTRDIPALRIKLKKRGFDVGDS